MIGVSGLSVTEAIAKANDLPIGVYVKEVVAGSAAEKGGIRTGDVIIACDGQTVTTIDDINKIRDTHKVGDTMTMKISRNGQERVVSIVLQEEKPVEQKKEEPQPQQPQQYQTIPFPFSWFGW